MRLTPSLIVTAVAAVACNHSFSPNPGTVHGIYAARTFMTTDSTGTTTDWIVAGGSLNLILAQGGAAGGQLLLPGMGPAGSDFIAISNTYITELIAKDLAGEPFAPYARLYEQFYFSFYRSTLSLYTNQYAIFGDPEVMPVKVIWDYTYYWGVLCQLFFQHRLTDLTAMARMRDELSLCMALNEAIQKLMREWSRVSAKRNGAQMLGCDAQRDAVHAVAPGPEVVGVGFTAFRQAGERALKRVAMGVDEGWKKWSLKDFGVRWWGRDVRGDGGPVSGGGDGQQDVFSPACLEPGAWCPEGPHALPPTLALPRKRGRGLGGFGEYDRAFRGEVALQVTSQGGQQE